MDHKRCILFDDMIISFCQVQSACSLCALNLISLYIRAFTCKALRTPFMRALNKFIKNTSHFLYGRVFQIPPYKFGVVPVSYCFHFCIINILKFSFWTEENAIFSSTWLSVKMPYLAALNSAENFRLTSP